MIFHQATSHQAYKEIKKTLGQRQAIVLNIFEFVPYAITNSEIAARLEWTINTVTPRTNELVKKGLLKEDGKRKCTITGRTAIAWRIKRPEENKNKQMDYLTKGLR